MDELQSAGVESEPVYGGCSSSVAAVAYDWMAEVFHVDSNLVLAARVEAQFNECVAVRAVENAVARDGELAVGVDGPGSGVDFMLGVLVEVRADGSLVIFDISLDNRNVVAFENHVVPVVLHGLFGLLVLGEHHQTRGVAVETVDDEDFVPWIAPFDVVAQY